MSMLSSVVPRNSLIAGSLGLFLAGSAAQGQCQYEVTVIQAPPCPIFGFEPTRGSGTNALGHVVGFHCRCLLEILDIAFLWTPESGLVDLAIPFGFSDARASDINDRGQIVGELEKGNLPHAALWQAGEVIELGTLPGGNFSTASAINNSGQIVGLAGNSDTGLFRPFLWQDGVMTDLKLPLGPKGRANDINETGAIVGWMGSSPFVAHAFMLHEGKVTDLGFMLGGLSGNAKAINNNGQIVGEGLVELKDGTQVSTSFLWDDGLMTDLGTLPNLTATRALDINDQGQVVGICHNPIHNVLKPFLWQHGVIRDLRELIRPDPDVRLFQAMAISNGGHIVGRGEFQFDS
ncbi:MAG: hypothetical protein IH888_13510, partial [Planctomycetes bacterium]|nr:hypothetical protein [Planctomycetota bacterium]